MDEFESVNEEQVNTSEMPDFTQMSDEEFAAMEPSFLDQDFDAGTQEGAPVDAEQETGDAEEDDDSDAAEDSPDAGEGLDADDDDGGDESLPDSDGDSPEGEEDGEGDAAEEQEGEEGTPEEATGEVDYKAEYDKLLTPFKANGKELRVTSVDEAKQLMQMGANYNKKMAGLKPHLKMLKLLENNGLLSEEKLSFLVDIEKKNPDAIKKLVKDSGIDPLDIDLEKPSEYQPQSYAVDDREIELDEVISEIRDTTTYRDTINVVTNQWDGPSKQVVAENPQLLKVINDHVASGIYEAISTEVERQRMFGRLTGLSDLEAYRTIGDELHEKGAFDQLASPQGESPRQQTPPPVRKKIVTPKSKTSDPKLSSKRRAASSTRTTPTKTQTADFNPLAMSDEEFDRLVNEKLM